MSHLKVGDGLVGRLYRMNEVFAKCVNFCRKIGIEGATSHTEVAVIKTDLKANRVGDFDLGVPEHWQISGCCRGIVENYPYTGLDTPLGLQDLETSNISCHSAHEYGKAVSSTHGPPLSLSPHFCGQNVSDNKKSQ